MSKIGIICTLIDAEDVIESYIKYHTSIGIDHFFLFFDDPNDPTIDIAKVFDNVTIIKNDNSLRKEWESTYIYKNKKEYRNYIDKELISRQLLNMEVGVKRAMEHDIDWVFHIDIDEFIFTHEQGLKKYFNSLPSTRINQRLYNYEAISEKVLIEDYFKEVTLFKVHQLHIQKNQRAQLKDLGIKFRFYQCGKSAGRVGPNLVPKNVDCFHQKGISWTSLMERTKSKLSEIALDFNPKVRDKKEPIILHYSVCGLEKFRRKYEIWGDFTDDYFEGSKISSPKVPFDRNSRDIVMQDDNDKIEEYYKTKVMMDDTKFINSMIEQGYFARIESPSKFLNNSK